MLTSSDSIGSESPLSARPASLVQLPLKIIALIVSYIDTAADLARVCSTCRVLNYMAVPLLYETLVLSTGEESPHNQKLPTGGRGSAFATGLNSLVRGNLGPMVHSLTLRGVWKEDTIQRHSNDFVMDRLTILNIAVRAALDKTTRLQEFSWELDIRMLDTVYLGLANLKISALHLRFPSTRGTQPVTVVPVMPHLVALSVTNIDPSLNQDDISTLLCSRKLQDLRMQWSPRMVDSKKPCVRLHDYFKRSTGSSRLRIKKLAFQNLHTETTDDLYRAIDQERIEEVTILNSSSCTFSMIFHNPSANSRHPSPIAKPGFKVMRHDKISRAHCDFLGSMMGLEQIYFVNHDARYYIERPSASPPAIFRRGSVDHDMDTIRVLPNGTSHPSPTFADDPKTQSYLKDNYFTTILSNHGQWLTHLLLSATWHLSTSMIARLVHTCPNLVQLGYATETSSFDTMTLLIPFLRNLVAIRLLVPIYPPNSNSGPPKPVKANTHGLLVPLRSRPLCEVVELDESVHIEKIGLTLGDNEAWGHLKLIGLGWKSYELGEIYAEPLIGSRPPSLPGTPTAQPRVTRRTSTPSGKPLQSTLGKRTRELRSTSNSSLNEHSNGGHPAVHNMDKEMEDAPQETERFVWRRRVRPVGWDVLKHWSIWAMDGSEM
ncbi:hypothetical protein BU16DRAFT_592071 [Lophium mytilinum]|uniref:Uncharacterized protein n=1 Tax=Lophium mytilinum TaxID=390894 RepID=A0A6A6QND7_9PEZI|nr:hypothetical protein BU16DRAFT_592071 [Lophium mytilinum]